jgi:hypothetical protein
LAELVGRTGSRGGYVAGKDGLPLVLRAVSAAAVASTAAAPETGRVTVVEISPGRDVHVVKLESALGRLSIGLVSPIVSGAGLVAAVQNSFGWLSTGGGPK